MGARSRQRVDPERSLDRVFRALGDRTRRALLAQLARGPAPITELAAPHAMSLPAVSKHVRVLERAGLVARAVDGRVHRCSLDAVPLRDAAAWIDEYRGFWEGALEALAEYVEAGEGDERRRGGRRRR
jgi:DNA-binding transcriptional ArsR family regulator